MDFITTIGNRTEGVEIVTLAQAKQNAKIDWDTEDDVLQMYLDAIPDEFENYLGNYIVERSVTFQLKSWPAKFVFPVGPIKSIDSITYKDEANEQQNLGDSNYRLLTYTAPPKQKVLFTHSTAPTLPSAEVEPYPITIVVTVGYAASDMPKDIKAAALLAFGEAEMFRENRKVPLNTSVQAKLRPYKRY